MRLNSNKKIMVEFIDVDNQVYFPRVTGVEVQEEEHNPLNSGFWVKFRKDVPYLNLGTLLGAVIGVISGILIGIKTGSTIGILLSLLLLLPTLTIGGSVVFHWRAFMGERGEVFVPFSYPQYYVGEKTLVLYLKGNLISYPIDGKYPKGWGSNINLIGKHHVIASEIRHLKQNKFGLLFIIILIVAVVSIGLYAFNSRNKPSPNNPLPGVTQNVTVTPAGGP